MSWFGGGKSKEDKFDDAALIRAARAQVLRQLKAASGAGGGGGGGGGGSHVINNLYGAGAGGVMDHLAVPTSIPEHEDPFDYMVDIERTNTPTGWTKKVKRYREDKKKA